MTAAINSFSGPYRFLSNFWMIEVRFDGETYASVEHAYQAAKVTAPESRYLIRMQNTPGNAKRMARIYSLRPEWVEIKLLVMEQLLRQKFDAVRYPDMAAALISTGSADLIEGNVWGDTFWGVCRGRGENHLGRLLMKIRAELVG